MGNQRTDFLVPTSGFLLGMATIANLSGNFFRYNSSASGAEADFKALRSDFAMVGQDIRSAKEQMMNPAAQMELPLCGEA